MASATDPDTARLPEQLHRFGPDFVFGTATAAYQIEGGVAEGGRAPSIRDTFSHTPGQTHRGDTGDVTTSASGERFREALLRVFSRGGSDTHG